MSDNVSRTGLPSIEDLEREKARRLKEAEAAIEREMKHELLQRLAAEFKYRLVPEEEAGAESVFRAAESVLGSRVEDRLSRFPASAEVASIRIKSANKLPEILRTQQSTEFDDTLGWLIDSFQADERSSYQKLEYATRQRHDQTLRRISDMYGKTKLFDIKASVLTAWYNEWRGDGKVAVASSFIRQIKTLLVYGTTILDNPECVRLYTVARALRFEMPKSRTERLTREHAVMIRRRAHEIGRRSIALAQAFQTELGLLQKSVIGEWVPLSERGESDVIHDGQKWLHGLRWEHIKEDGHFEFIFRGMGRSIPKRITANLNDLPMIKEELDLLRVRDPNLRRQGPLIICEGTDRPWIAGEYRRWWRRISESAGVPKWLKNMDARLDGANPVVRIEPVSGR